MNNHGSATPPLRYRLIGSVCGIFFGLLFIILPEYQRGESFAAACRRALAAAGWPGVTIVLTFILVLIWVAFPLFFRWIKAPQGERSGQYIWRRYRAVITWSTVLGLVGLLVYFLQAAFAGPKADPDQQLFLGFVALVFFVSLVLLWTRKPSEERIKALETGEYDRVLDERYRDIQGRAAVSTIYFMMAVLLIGGGLYDMVVTRMWPLRTLGEVILIGLVWNLQYFRWDKKL